MLRKYVVKYSSKVQDVKRITKGHKTIAQFVEMVGDDYAILQVGEFTTVYAAVLKQDFQKEHNAQYNKQGPS